jgi:hypothetical protein
VDVVAGENFFVSFLGEVEANQADTDLRGFSNKRIKQKDETHQQ